MPTIYATVSTSVATPPPTEPVLLSAGLDPHDGVQAPLGTEGRAVLRNAWGRDPNADLGSGYQLPHLQMPC